MFEGDGCGCGAGATKIRQIKIDGKEVGIAGILELFKGYYEDGKNPEEVAPDDLLENLGEMNHIPEDKEEEYGEAFMREYRRYHRDREEKRPPKLLKK